MTFFLAGGALYAVRVIFAGYEPLDGAPKPSSSSSTSGIGNPFHPRFGRL